MEFMLYQLQTESAELTDQQRLKRERSTAVPHGADETALSDSSKPVTLCCTICHGKLGYSTRQFA